MYEHRDNASAPARVATPSFFARYRPVISAALKAELSHLDLGVYSTHRYYMGWEDEGGRPVSGKEGKRLRPTLALLGCDALGGDVSQAVPIATALEFIHNFSLIHDDLEDLDDKRHDRATIWVVWGDSIAIISGNAMLQIADRAAKGLVYNGVSPSMALRIQMLITRSYLHMVEGQYLDLDYETRSEVSISEYLAMIDRKTGALIRASLYLGALVATHDDSDCYAADDLGMAAFEIGRMFQIRDDMLGVWGGDETGKPVGSDLRRKKKALPTVHIMNSARGAAKRRIEEIFDANEVDDSDVEDMLSIMEESGTYGYCMDVAQSHWDSAVTVLERINLDDSVKGDFRELGEYLLDRES